MSVLVRYPFSPDDIFVAVGLKVGDIVTVYQVGVRHNYKILQFIFADKFSHYRKHCMPLVLVALMDAIGQRITAEAH